MARGLKHDAAKHAVFGFGGVLKSGEIVPRDPSHQVSEALALLVASIRASKTALGPTVPKGLGSGILKCTWGSVLRVGLEVRGGSVLYVDL